MPRGQFAHPLKSWFKPGHAPWLKGTKGLAKANRGSFQKGHKAGVNHHRYNGGLCIDKRSGRFLIWCRNNRYEFFSRAVIESHLMRPLETSEIVHHLNGDPTDDRISNLVILSRPEHTKIHQLRRNDNGQWKRNQRD